MYIYIYSLSVGSNSERLNPRLPQIAKPWKGTEPLKFLYSAFLYSA